jgi:TolB-like protein/Tfp pilus assembly protein PilF
MASLIPGYEYDIFISYRQKDNKGDKWVSEVVDSLKTELESTFKEEISVYFDINPHDGLLETYDVDASLKDKLKCLVFIPIISRTYCDPKSFAWEYEFKAFIEQASQDEFGLKVKLPNGNVASRILPIQIHDLDVEDKKLIEIELGGFLRGIEFIYKEPGVNRPLMVNEDHPDNNLNKTFYRNQVNKVANAVKEIITAIKKLNQHDGEAPKQEIKEKLEHSKKLKPELILIIFLTFALIVLGYFLIPKIFNFSKPLEKSIAVLPFINDSPNDSTTYFMDGVMEEVLSNLQSIKDLRVLSRTSTDQYKGPNKPTIPEIAKKLGVNYIVEGSGQKSGNKFRLRVQLIRASKESHLWSKSYEQENPDAKDYFSIQSQIAQAIATQLEAVITPQEKQLIQKTPTVNLAAYDAYLKGEYYRKKYTQNDLETAMKYYKIALENDPGYALAYSGIANVWFGFSAIGYLYPSEGLPKGYAALMTAQKLDSTLAEVHLGLADYKFYNEWDWKSAESEFQKTLRIKSNLAEAHTQYATLLNVIGRHEEAMKQIQLALKIDPYDPFIISLYGLDLLYLHRYADAIVACHEALNLEPTSNPGLTNLIIALHLSGRYEEALETWKTSNNISYPGFTHTFDQGYAKAGYIGALSLEADTLAAQSKTSYINPMDIAWLYICSGNKERTLDYMEHAYEVHDQNLVTLTLPLFDCLRNEPRYQALCKKMNLPIK